MNNMDIKLKKINENDLINPQKFQKLMEERDKKYSEYFSKVIDIENNKTRNDIKGEKGSRTLNKAILDKNGK